MQHYTQVAPQETATTLVDVMGLELVGTEGDYTRFKASADIGNIIDLKMVTGVRGTDGCWYGSPYCMACSG